ncbi:MAG: hypothetical protein VXY93_21635, partial [Pseudomonadota bacterium]|nr:hypothetical protein [Pseudomonadota bacterium]
QHDGKVGIGTGIPTSNLDVRGASSATISIGLQGISYGAFACNSSSNILYAYNGNDIIFSTHAGGGFGQKVTIKNNGNVGINSSAPTAILDVVGQTNLDNVSVVGVATITSSTYPLNVHADTTYQGILINGNVCPTVNFARNNSTTPEWKAGLSGNNADHFSISVGSANNDRLILR